MLLVGLPVHEFSHALAAYRLGDGTAKLFGRLTLNPIAHFDPVGGTLLALTFIGSAATGAPFGFGWAKPTPVNPMNLEGGRRGEAIVAAAGPLSNLILADRPARSRSGSCSPTRSSIGQFDDRRPDVLYLFVQINLLLMIFNFIPIPPLDGSKVMFAFMDRRTEYQIRPILEQYGFFILLIAILFFPPGNSIGRRIIDPDPRMRSIRFLVGDLGPASSGRTCGRRVTPEERAALAAWTDARAARASSTRCTSPTGATASMSSPRCAPSGVTDPDLLVAGLLHDAGKGDTGVWPRVAYTLGQRYGHWVWRGRRGPARVRAGARAAPDARRDRPPRWPPAAGCSARTVELIRDQDAPTDPEFGELLRLADEAN